MSTGIADGTGATTASVTDLTEENTVNKYLRFIIPDYDNQSNDSFLHIGNRPQDGEAALSRTGSGLWSQFVHFAHDSEIYSEVGYLQDRTGNDIFDPDADLFGLDVGTARTDFYANLGWRDHTDGNRLTTTGGDKVEVIGGNYRLIVLSRAKGAKNYNEEVSGGLYWNCDDTPTVVTKMEYKSTKFDGTWKVTEESTKGHTRSIFLGETQDEFRGTKNTSIVGTPNITTMTTDQLAALEPFLAAVIADNGEVGFAADDPPRGIAACNTYLTDQQTALDEAKVELHDRAERFFDRISYSWPEDDWLAWTDSDLARFIADFSSHTEVAWFPTDRTEILNMANAAKTIEDDITAKQAELEASMNAVMGWTSPDAATDVPEIHRDPEVFSGTWAKMIFEHTQTALSIESHTRIGTTSTSVTDVTTSISDTTNCGGTITTRTNATTIDDATDATTIKEKTNATLKTEENYVALTQTTTHGAQHDFVMGATVGMFLGASIDMQLAETVSLNAGFAQELFLGVKSEFNIGNFMELFIARKAEFNVTGKDTVDIGDTWSGMSHKRQALAIFLG